MALSKTRNIAGRHQNGRWLSGRRTRQAMCRNCQPAQRTIAEHCQPKLAISSPAPTRAAEKTPAAWKRSALPLYRSTTTSFIFPTEVCTGIVRTKEQSQRRVCNLILIMVFNDRPTCKDGRAQRNSSWLGARGSQKGRIHCRRLVFSPKLPLAVARRTIQYQDLSDSVRLFRETLKCVFRM
jgi:hypothetical protein